MTPIFFALAPHFKDRPDYESGVRTMASRFDFRPVFAHQAPTSVDPSEWVSDALADCEYAVFDFTGLDASVLFAYGLASQNDDVTSAAFISVDGHATASSRSNSLALGLIAKAKQFVRADDLAREAQMFVVSKMGASKLLGNAFVAEVKKTIKSKGPVHMRQLAKYLSRPMSDVQPVVYELVRDGKIRKLSDKRWAQYETRDA